jgi:hypothetical protein
MSPKPLLESFASLEDYLEALVGWHMDRNFDRAWHRQVAALIEWHMDQRFNAVDQDWLRKVGVKPE